MTTKWTTGGTIVYDDLPRLLINSQPRFGSPLSTIPAFDPIKLSTRVQTTSGSKPAYVQPTPIYLPSNSIVGRVGPGGQLNPPYSPPTPIYLPSNSIVGRVGPGGQLNPPYSPPTPISLKSQLRRATDNMSDGWAPRIYKRKQRTNKAVRKPIRKVLNRVRRK